MIGFVLHNSMQLHSEQSLVLQGISTNCNNSDTTSSPGSADELTVLPELAAGSDDDTVVAIAHK